MVATNLDLELGRSPAEADAISPWLNQRTDLQKEKSAGILLKPNLVYLTKTVQRTQVSFGATRPCQRNLDGFGTQSKSKCDASALQKRDSQTRIMKISFSSTPDRLLH